MEEYKVIFHVDEMNKWNLALKNVMNLLDGSKDEIITIEILANSEAVQFYKSRIDTDTGILEQLHGKGVRLTACNNALRAFNLGREDLLSYVEIVPVGVLELIKRQTEGYAYIRP